MTVGNGKDHNATTMPEAVEMHGGAWRNGHSGSAVTQMQIAQLHSAREAQAKLVQLEAQRQITLMNLKAEADAAEKQFVLAMASSDYEGAAAACRKMTRAEAKFAYLSEWK
jgi:hypothetical protein